MITVVPIATTLPSGTVTSTTNAELFVQPVAAVVAVGVPGTVVDVSATVGVMVAVAELGARAGADPTDTMTEIAAGSLALFCVL